MLKIINEFAIKQLSLTLNINCILTKKQCLLNLIYMV